MTENNKQLIDQLRANITRYDAYYNSVNTKARFIMIFAVFIIGTVILKSDSFIHDVSPVWVWGILLTALGILLLSSFFILILVVSSVSPYLEDGNADKEENTSIIFFRDVANSGSKKNYLDRVTAQSEESMIEDLSRQCFILADGLDKKFRKLKKAYIALYVIIGCLFVVTIIKVGGSI